MDDSFCGKKGLFTMLLSWKLMDDGYCSNKGLFYNVVVIETDG